MHPISHGLLGWMIAQPLMSRRDRILVTASALIPDIDGVTIIAGLEAYGRYHHTFGHNVFAAIVTGAACGVAARSRVRTTLLSVAAFHIHLVTDMLGSGAAWPITYFWPFSLETFAFGPPLQWELDSWQNLLITFMAMVFIGVFGAMRGRTVVEVASVRADAQVVQVLRKWAGRSK